MAIKKTICLPIGNFFVGIKWCYFLRMAHKTKLPTNELQGVSYKTNNLLLYRKALTTTAGSAGIGITEIKPFAIETIGKIQSRVHEV